MLHPVQVNCQSPYSMAKWATAGVANCMAHVCIRGAE